MMGKLMPLDILSSIKGAKSSEAVKELFEVIKGAATGDPAENIPDESSDLLSLEDLRSDIPVNCPGDEKEVIRQNFPGKKNGFLRVPKVIEE